MPSLGELWKISGIFYRNLGFLSYAQMRQLNLKGQGMEKLAHNASNSLLFNKIFLSLIFFMMALFGAMESSVISYAAYLLLLLFMFSFFFLQIVTYFFSLNFDILRVFPIPPRDIKKVILLTFLRIFDIPLIVNLAVFPVTAAFIAHWYSFTPAFLGVIIDESYSVALVVYLSKIFYTKLSQPTGGWRSVLRIIYQIIWGATFFIFYAFMMWIRVIYIHLEEYMPFVEKYSFIFKLLFPFNVAYLMLFPDLISLLSSIVFVLLAYFSVKWTLENIGMVGKISYEEKENVPEKMVLRITTPLRGIVKKDLKLISRNPGLLILALLPAFESILLISIGNSPLTSLGVVFTFVIILIYTLFGYEKMSIMRTMPVPKGIIYLSKNIIGVSIYFISLIIVDIYLFLRGGNIGWISQGMILPAVFSAGIICVYVGDLLGIKKSVAIGALGFIVILALGNAIVYLPLLASKWSIVSLSPIITGFMVSVVEFFIGILIIRIIK